AEQDTSGVLASVRSPWRMSELNESSTSSPLRREIISDMSATRPHRAGESIEDYCRACKTDRMHTIVVVDGDGVPIRVDCGFCHSEHNYRGGPRVGQSAAPQHSASRGQSPAGPAVQRPERAQAR